MKKTDEVMAYIESQIITDARAPLPAYVPPSRFFDPPNAEGRAEARPSPKPRQT